MSYCKIVQQSLSTYQCKFVLDIDCDNMWKTVLQVVVSAFLLLHAARGKLENSDLFFKLSP